MHSMTTRVTEYPWGITTRAVFWKIAFFSAHNRFMNGATPLELDASDRLLLPKNLMDHAGVGKDIKMIGMVDRVEIWSKEAHAKMLREQVDLTALAEDVMGSLGNSDGQ